MRYLATFLLFCVACLSYSQKVSYDSLQNINKNNYTQLVGQTLYAPKGELVVRNLFWSNKSGKIYKPHPDWVLYPKYSTPDDVLNKHYLIEKVITKSTPLLKTRIKETDDVVYINLDALLNYTTSPVMFVDGYIQKCRQQFLNRHLYIDKTKYKRSLPSSFNTKVPNLASFYCNNILVTTTTSQNYGGLLLLSDRVTSSTPKEMSVVDYLRSQVSKSKADEMIRQREIELAQKAREDSIRKAKEDSIARQKKLDYCKNHNFSIVPTDLGSLYCKYCEKFVDIPENLICLGANNDTIIWMEELKGKIGLYYPHLHKAEIPKSLKDYDQYKYHYMAFEDSLKQKFKTTSKLIEIYNSKKYIDHLTPTQVTAGSNIKVYWKCHVCGYEWNGMVITQAKAKYGCEKCAYKEKSLKRFGDKPLVETHAYLADEWDYKKNGELTPYNVTAHLHKRVNWVCHKGHHWAAFVSVRSRLNIGCPHCKKEWGTSFPEQAIYFYLRKVTEAQNRYMFKGEEIDIFLGDKEWNTAIEYDGVYYHSTVKSQNREKKKNQLLADNGIRLIRIKEDDYDRVSNGIIYVKYQSDHSYLKWVINEILRLCGKEKYVDQLDIDIERDRNQIYALYIQSEKENSIVAKMPEVAKQWDYEKNGDIKPEYIPCTSQKKFYWKCEKGHSWKAQVNTRLMGHGCPHCAGIIMTPGENDLLSQNPELVKEWDYDRNGDLTPDKITVNNSKRVWWVCKTCGHHWAVGVAHRNKGEGCPKCADKQRTLSKHKRIVALKGSFADNYPQLLKEWDYVRNGGLDPKTLPPHCGKKVWWICRTCGHSWQATMDARAKGSGCTKCADKQRTLSRRKKFIELKGAFADTHPHLIKDWDYSKNEGTPNDYSAGSHYRASWKCHHCGYEWEVSISKRTVGHKCPNCHK